MQRNNPTKITRGNFFKEIKLSSVSNLKSSFSKKSFLGKYIDIKLQSIANVLDPRGLAYYQKQANLEKEKK